MGLKIKLTRIKLNKKQKDVAEAIGVSQQYLSNLENGLLLNPSIDIMKKLAIELQTTPQELFFSE